MGHILELFGRVVSSGGDERGVKDGKDALDELTEMLRGYYLYGASKEVLGRGLEGWYKD